MKTESEKTRKKERARARRLLRRLPELYQEAVLVGLAVMEKQHHERLEELRKEARKKLGLQPEPPP